MLLGLGRHMLDLSPKKYLDQVTDAMFELEVLDHRVTNPLVNNLTFCWHTGLICPSGWGERSVYWDGGRLIWSQFCWWNRGRKSFSYPGISLSSILCVLSRIISVTLHIVKCYHQNLCADLWFFTDFLIALICDNVICCSVCDFDCSYLRFVYCSV
jgi:hypothetical protein